MARLPTVKLRNKKTGAKSIVNQTDYARDIAAWKDWEIISMRSGDASDEDVKFAAQQSDLDKHWKTDDARERKFGDKERAFKERSQTTTNIVTEPKADPAPTPAEPEQVPTKWWELRQYVKDKTGTMPKNKEEATKLLSEQK